MKKILKNNKSNIKKITYLFLVLIWMGIIFYFSNQPGVESSNTSSKVVEYITKITTQFGNSNIEGELNGNIISEHLIRKIAHYLIYTAGGIIILNYVNAFNLKDKNKILYSILIGVVYAISDEIHQYFIVGRSAQIKDVIIDSAGIVTGILLFTILNLKKKNIDTNNKSI